MKVQIVTLATIAALAAALPQGGEPPSGTASETSMSTMPTESTSMPGETSTMPPEETSTMPPEETSTMPPEETSTMPPEETSTMPPDSTSTMPNGVPAPTETGMAIHPNGNMSKCVDVAGAEFSNGTPVQIYDCNDTEAQKFVFTEGETKVKVANHDYCLDAGSDPASGTMAKIWQCYEDLDAQSFYYTDDYRMAVLGEGLCLDLTDGMMANGTVLQTWYCTDNNTNQIWN
ncbi:Endo-1,4-beta-xylanase A [Wallemia ichthyophaga EXF-994]|uniref:Endo-1,4-beta-xylanase A n=1 Tax=Wallemia ichthyophaga (strain EXF-994 / CBS 113033) TaxID=1299270 RepID=R9AAG2_WALI9|nr:Endo-1,4-beta-xylanase A [Wallemia ichthyophaga EXF-994]EOQ99171.1 Endo-1,4-beta-xylanase A [Wallemia ichthyophaga EXF-994]